MVAVSYELLLEASKQHVAKRQTPAAHSICCIHTDNALESRHALSSVTRKQRTHLLLLPRRRLTHSSSHHVLRGEATHATISTTLFTLLLHAMDFVEVSHDVACVCLCVCFACVCEHVLMCEMMQ